MKRNFFTNHFTEILRISSIKLDTLKEIEYLHSISICDERLTECFSILDCIERKKFEIQKRILKEKNFLLN